MSTKMTLEISSSSSEETEQLGEVLGRQLKGGEVIELLSDLGGGKTTFTRGLIRGTGSTSHVSSPTFKICNTYKSKDLVINHYDFYRLHEAGLIEHELEDSLSDPKTVTVVEWSDVVKHVLPSNRISVKITTKSEDSRLLTFEFPKELQQLMNVLS